jgi:hypothetical protein
MLTMFCRYGPMFTISGWQLLRRQANRCGTPRKLGTVHTRFGEHFPVPRGSGRGIVVMDVHDVPTSVWQRLRSLLFRRDGVFVIVNKAVVFRVIPDTITERAIVRVPHALDYGGAFPLSIDAGSLAFFTYGGPAHGPPMTVDFYEVPVTSPAAR